MSDLIYGPLYHRLLHGHAPVDHAFVDDVVDLALHGILAAGPARPHIPARPTTHTEANPVTTAPETSLTGSCSREGGKS